jgi:GNAT superfamily N-acetyltransferase
VTAPRAPSDATFRRAERADVEPIVRLLADDVLGAKRERYVLPLPPSYFAAFDAIAADPNNELLVACRDGAVAGVLQVTYTPGLTYQGGWRATIEGVRVDARIRSAGLGRALIEHAIECARSRGCHLVQLTTDKARPDARRFYEAIGFVATHEGMKLRLEA